MFLMKVLIVDDNAQMRKMICEYLPPQSDVLECSDGDEAVAVYSLYHPDWVLMDLKMARMDGITATEEIHKTAPDAKVIIVTNYDDEQTRRAATRVGALILSKENLFNLNNLMHEAPV